MTTRVLASLEARCWEEDGVLHGRQRAAALDELASRSDLTAVARPTPREPGGQRVIRHGHGWLPLAGASSLLPLVRAVRSSRAVVVYLPGYVSLLIGALAIVLRRRLVCIVVGDPEYALGRDVLPGAKGAMMRTVITLAMRLMLSRASVVRYVTREYLQSRYPAPRSIAFAITDARPAVTDARQPVAVPGTALRVLTVGSLDRPYKGIPDLIRGLVGAGRPGVDVEVQVAGSGRLADQQLSALAVPDWLSVRPLGQLSEADLTRAYLEADLFALASWSEGLPRTLVEAMAAGLPCVATRVGGVPELLDDSCLAEPRDTASLARALRPLLADHALRAAYGERNREVITQLLHEARSREPLFVDAIVEKS